MNDDTNTAASAHANSAETAMTVATADPTPVTAATALPTTLAVWDGTAFEETVKAKTRQRRQQQLTALSQLRVRVQRVEAALAGESKRRMECHRTLAQESKQHIESVYQKLKEQISNDQLVVTDRLNEIERGLQELKEQWEGNVASLKQDIGKTQETFKTSMSELQTQLQKERVNRTQRQEQLEQQIQKLTEESRELWTSERQERLGAVNSINTRLDDQDGQREKQLRDFEQGIKEELELLQQELHQESTERQAHDEQIVTGLNQYIQQVQKSLSYVSGV